MEDIEDLASAAATPRQKAVGVGRRRGATAPACAVDVAAADDDVPGAHSVYLKTYGCSHNSSDSEV